MPVPRYQSPHNGSTIFARSARNVRMVEDGTIGNRKSPVHSLPHSYYYRLLMPLQRDNSQCIAEPCFRMSEFCLDKIGVDTIGVLDEQCVKISHTRIIIFFCTAISNQIQDECFVKRIFFNESLVDEYSFSKTCRRESGSSSLKSAITTSRTTDSRESVGRS